MAKYLDPSKNKYLSKQWADEDSANQKKAKKRKPEANRKDESYSDYLIRHQRDKNLTGVEKSDLSDTLAFRKKTGYGSKKKVAATNNTKPATKGKPKATKKKIAVKR